MYADEQCPPQLVGLGHEKEIPSTVEVTERQRLMQRKKIRGLAGKI